MYFRCDERDPIISAFKDDSSQDWHFHSCTLLRCCITSTHEAKFKRPTISGSWHQRMKAINCYVPWLHRGALVCFTMVRSVPLISKEPWCMEALGCYRAAWTKGMIHDIVSPSVGRKYKLYAFLAFRFRYALYLSPRHSPLPCMPEHAPDTIPMHLYNSLTVLLWWRWFTQCTCCSESN